MLQATSKEFYELDVEDTVRSQLAHKTVYEYPVIHVAISANPDRFPVAICEKPVILVKTDAAMPVAEPEMQGTSFREEEIEDGEFIPWNQRNSSDLNDVPCSGYKLLQSSQICLKARLQDALKGVHVTCADHE